MARLLPHDFHRYFKASWSPWGQPRIATILLNLAQRHGMDINAVFDFSMIDEPGWRSGSQKFKGTLLEAWHRLHTDQWEHDLQSLQKHRPLKMYTAWFDLLKQLHKTGFKLNFRQRALPLTEMHGPRTICPTTRTCASGFLRLGPSWNGRF